MDVTEELFLYIESRCETAGLISPEQTVVGKRLEKMDACASLTYTPHREFAPACTKNNPAVRDPMLISRAQRGDLDAFNELVLSYQDMVYRQALWILREPEAAEDATQEAFLLAYRHIQSFRGGLFRPWLMCIATNYCLDQIRYAKRRPTQPLESTNEDGEEHEAAWLRDPADSPEQVLERSELGEDIMTCVQKLPLEYRLPIILVDLQELDYEEASRIMRIPLGTFKSRLARARLKLKSNLSVFNIRK